MKVVEVTLTALIVGNIEATNLVHSSEMPGWVVHRRGALSKVLLPDMFRLHV